MDNPKLDIQLLAELLSTLANRAPNSSDDGSSGYNLFKAIGIEHKEVLTCRFLASLLDPNGNHGYGTKALELFMKIVLCAKDQLSKDAYVQLEEQTDGGRRVDIVIHNDSNVYPIEVKIWAGDQDAQLIDYYRYFFGNSHESKIYYLTPGGWKPSETSKGDLQEGQISCISFEKDIKCWLNALMNNCPENTVPNGILYQYIEVIKEMCAASSIERDIYQWVWSAGSNNCDNNERLGALIRLLDANGDKNSKIQRTIQCTYLREKLQYNSDKYDLLDMEDDEKKKYDTHALLKIVLKNTQRLVAWISVDTNLYLGCIKRKKDQKSKQWKSDEKNWAYIRPADHKHEKYCLNDCLKILSCKGEIDIRALLDDVDLSEAENE